MTLKGYIVVSLGFLNDEKDFILTVEEKELLTNMMYQKIEMSDVLFVINPGGYIGESTKAEIEYVESLGKTIIYLC